MVRGFGSGQDRFPPSGRPVSGTERSRSYDPWHPGGGGLGRDRDLAVSIGGWRLVYFRADLLFNPVLRECKSRSLIYRWSRIRNPSRVDLNLLLWKRFPSRPPKVHDRD